MAVQVLVTGARGFVGRNLSVALGQRPGVALTGFDVPDDRRRLEEALARADVVYHLAGVNRPQREEEFAAGNAGFTEEVLALLARAGRTPRFVLASSVHAATDTPYGRSKRAAEDALRRHCEATGAEGVAFRFRHLFGKWCRPHYNSVTATFCDDVARGRPLHLPDPEAVVSLTWVDDVVEAFQALLEAPHRPGFRYGEELPAVAITVGELARTLQAFRAARAEQRVPDLSRPFTRALYGTYLSYLPPEELAQELPVRRDGRGCLAEVLKTVGAGQIFVSRSRPGVVRGNHHHRGKVEKFLVVQGEALIRLRRLGDAEIQTFRVRGEELRVVDIPPGYTHALENVGPDELITLFWASEVFDPARPDTWAEPVEGEPCTG